MRKMRKMARRHRPIAKATNPFWRSQRFTESSAEECLVHVPPCVRGDDGLWHQPGGEQPVRIDNIESRDRDVVIRGEKGWVE